MIDRLTKVRKSMAEGASPKLMMSANESRSLPMGEAAWRRRAARPSRKSNPTAMKMNVAAIGYAPLKAAIVAMQPQIRLQQVRALGMCWAKVRMKGQG